MKPVIFAKIIQKKKIGEKTDFCGKIDIVGMHPHNIIDLNYKNAYIKDIARASSAAYPFFAATNINNKEFVDGGFLFNNVDILLVNLLK